MVLGIAN